MTPIANGTFITFSEAQAGVGFLPSPNSTSDGHFDVESSQNGSTVAAQSGKATSTITVTPVGDMPQVANNVTLEDTLSGPIVIGRHPNDGNEVTHFQISGLVGGTLFKSDGVTQIANGNFITFAEAQAGMRFLPSPNSTSAGHFDVESSQNGSTVAAQSGKAAGTITVTPVGDTPQVANSVTLEDTLSGPIVIARHPNDGNEVSHFKISGLVGGTLFKSDGVTQIASGTFITFAEAQAGVRFLPSAHSTSDGHFDVESSQNGTTVAAQSGKVASSITVTPVGDTPQVANSTTLEDILSGAITIGRHPNDGSEVTHFKISGIVGGTLFKSDGVTPIANGTLITFAEAQAGVRFLPSANTTSDGHFDVESSQNGTTVAAQSGKATSAITVTPVGDTPQVASSVTLEDTLSGPIVIGRHPNDGNEVTHFKISGIVGGTLFKNDGVTPIANGSFITLPEAQAGVRFFPTTNSTSDGHFDVESSQNGSTAAAQSGKATSTITVTPVNDSPTIAPIPDPPAILQDAGLQSIGLSGISAGGGEVQTLSIIATSNNPALIADPAMTYTQGNATAMLSYSPIANQHGTATITVTVNDGGQGGIVSRQFIVTVLALNTAPTSLDLTNAVLAENQPAGTVVGTFSTLDPDVGNTFTYTLAMGAGDTNNTSFQIIGNQLRTAGPFDFEAGGTYPIRVQSTDQDGLSVAAIFVVTVLDVNEAPTAVILQNVVSSLPENLSTVAAIPLASIQVTDDAPGSETLTLTGSDPAFFQIVGSELQLKPGVTLNFETRSSYSVTINANDPTVGATPDALTTLILTITDVNEPPTLVTLQNVTTTLPENTNTAAAVTLADIVVADDALGSATLTLSGPDAAFFQIVGNELQLKAGVVLNFEVQTSYAVTVNADDTAVGVTPDVSANLMLTIINVNESPTDVALSSTSLSENNAANVTVGTLSASDPDSGSTFTYILVSGTGSTDNGSFSIIGNTLMSTPSTDFETQGSYAIRVQVTDQDGLTFEKPFTISVMNVDESPTISGFAPQSIQEDTPTGNLFVTIGDPETPAENLILSVSSSNTVLVPNANIVISGTGANRSLVLTPVANHSGSATITVTVSDGVLSSEQTIQVTVLAVDDPAVITLNSQPLDYRVSLRTVAIDESATLMDVDTPTLTFNGAVLRVSGQSAKDTLSLLNLNGIRHKGRNVVSGTTVIGVLAGGKKGVPLTVSLNGSATQNAVQSLLRSIAFKSVDKAAGHRTIHMQITNMGGMNTNQAIRQIHIGPAVP